MKHPAKDRGQEDHVTPDIITTVVTVAPNNDKIMVEVYKSLRVYIFSSLYVSWNGLMVVTAESTTVHSAR